VYWELRPADPILDRQILNRLHEQVMPGTAASAAAPPTTSLAPASVPRAASG
jgi:hypothetical protein